MVLENEDQRAHWTDKDAGTNYRERDKYVIKNISRIMFYNKYWKVITGEEVNRDLKFNNINNTMKVKRLREGCKDRRLTNELHIRQKADIKKNESLKQILLLPRIRKREKIAITNSL